MGIKVSDTNISVKIGVFHEFNNFKNEFSIKNHDYSFHVSVSEEIGHFSIGEFRPFDEKSVIFRILI